MSSPAPKMATRRSPAPLPFALALLAALPLATPLRAEDDGKAAEDPTRISTQLGIGYADDVSVSGSLAFGKATKLNARFIKGGQWSLGASYLFPFGILTLTGGRNEFDNGAVQTRYSLGGFVPLTAMGLKTGKWQVFVPFGYSYSHGEMSTADVELSGPMLIEVTSNSGYLGLFGIRPLSQRLTLMLAGMGSKGSHDYSGVNLGGGLSYHLTDKDTFAVFAHYMDNSFGQEQKLGLSYKHEF